MVRVRMGRARALALVIASGVTLVGLVVLVAGWIAVGVASFQAASDPQGGCLAGLEQSDSEVRYDILPPRAVCTWAPGSRESGAQEVVAEAPWALAGAGLAGAGLLGLAAWWGTGRVAGARRDTEASTR